MRDSHLLIKPNLYSNNTGYDGTTGGWNTAVEDSENNPIQFASGESLTFSVSNLVPHIALNLTVYGGATGTPSASDVITLTGPNGQQVSGGDTGGTLVNATFITSASSATFTLKVTVPGVDDNGNPRTWSIGGTSLTSYDGGLNDAASAAVDVGGETYVPVSLSSNGTNVPAAGDVLKVMNYDPSVIQVMSDTVTLDSNGQGELLIKGVGGGHTPLILQDSIGDEAITPVFSDAPRVSATGTVTQGVTNNASGFTFSVYYPSVTAITVNFNTSGSTLPNSLMGNLSSGSVTIPASTDTDSNVFVPVNVGDDGKIAPTRFIVIGLEVPNVPPATQPQAKLEVDNTDLPGITIDGEQNGANVTVDPQGDPTLLVPVKLTINHDGDLDSATLSWDPTQDVIWPTDTIGPDGTDLASMPGSSSDPYDGTVSYTWYKDIPTKLWDQAIGGSPTDGATSLELGADVSQPATTVVPKETTSPTKMAHDTQAGIIISVSGYGMVADPDPSVVGQISVGAGVTVEVFYLGPNFGYGTDITDIGWSIQGDSSNAQRATAIAGYSQSQNSGLVSVLIPTALQQPSVHFYFLADENPSDIRKISVHATVGDTGYGATEAIRVLTPDSNLALQFLDSTPNSPAVGFSDNSSKVTNGTPSLHFGTLNGFPGVTYIPTATAPSFIGGTIKLVQLVNTFTAIGNGVAIRTVRTKSYELDSPDGNVEMYGKILDLDKGGSGELEYDPNSIPPVYITDSPFVGAGLLSGSSSIIRYFFANTYLMWRPKVAGNVSTDSIFVSLQRADWYFIGAVVYNPVTYKVSFLSGDSSSGVMLGYPYFSLPQWNGYAQDPSNFHTYTPKK